MICPRCKVEMVDGFALPEQYEPGNICRGFGHGHIVTADNLELIPCLKCPSCGFSDDGACKRIRSYSGDLYEVPCSNEHEIKDYNHAIGVIENHWRGVGTKDEYMLAIKSMEKYETGQTGWRYISGK